MYIPQITNITPFDPLVFKSHFYNWDWKTIEPICVDLIGDNPKKIYLEQVENLKVLFIPLIM